MEDFKPKRPPELDPPISSEDSSDAEGFHEFCIVAEKLRKNPGNSSRNLLYVKIEII